jgi:hypothetical protein
LFLYYRLQLNLHLLPYLDRIKTVKTKSNYGSITACLKSLGQGQHRGFFLSCRLRSNYGSNQAARASEQPGGGQGQHRSLFLYYRLGLNLRLLPYFDRIKTVKTKLNYGSSEKSGAGAAPRLFPLLSFTVELRQQPSSQGQQAARERPGAEPQLVPLLSFTVALLKNYDLLRLLPYFDRIKTALKVDEIKYSFCFRIPALIDF